MFLIQVEEKGAADERKVGQSLREVAQKCLRVRVHLFCIEPHIIGTYQSTLPCRDTRAAPWQSPIMA